MDKSAFQARLRREGFEVEAKGLPANEARAEHAHHFDVEALVTAGKITITCEGTARTYGAGDSFTMAAGKMHAEQVGPEGVEYIVGRRH
jgi:quercetin dioxygenase-like cupin family protein